MSVPASTADPPPRSETESLRRLWQLAGGLRRRIALGIAFRFAQSMSLGLSFGVAVWIVADLAGGRAMTARWAWQVTGLMALSLAGQLLFGFLAVRENWITSYRFVGGLRLSMLDHLQRLPMGFHLSRDKGDTATALTTDMQAIAGFLSDALPRIAQACGLPAAIILFLLWREWVVALAAAASILTAVPVFLWSSRRMAELGILRQDRQAAAVTRMIEYVQGMAVIRAFNQLARGRERFRASLEAFRDISVTMVARLTWLLIAFAAILMMGVPIVMVVAGARYDAAAIDQGTVIAVLMLVFSVYAPLLGLISVLETVRIADASLTRVDRIMTARPLPAPAAAQEPKGASVRFEDVAFSYVPGTPVLRGVSFEVPERGMTAIVGASGSGKSTILNLLPRFWDVDSGRITVGGTDVRTIAPERLASLIAVVFQDVYLFAGTIYDNIALGRNGARPEEVRAAADAAQAHDFITALPNGYRTIIGEGGMTLSGGERQRLSIARAILKDAPIVLLDEATAAIDPTNERAIQAALSRLVAEKTLIVVAHRLQTIRSADQILVLEDGTIVERGTHDDLLEQRGRYCQLWNQRLRAAAWTIAAQDEPGERRR